MKRFVRAGLLALTAASLLAGAGCRRRERPPAVTIAGKTWQVELATTARQRYVGLAGRSRLSENAGMLFVFPRPKVRNFCMRGCLIPLDVAFISAGRQVIAIHTMSVEPGLAGRTAYSSSVPAQYALEVPAGALARAGVTTGQRVTFTGDIPAATKAEPSP